MRLTGSRRVSEKLFFEVNYIYISELQSGDAFEHVLVGFALSQNTRYTSSITGKAKVTFFIMIKAKFLNWVLHLLFLVYTETASILQLDFCSSCSYYSVDVNCCFKIHILDFSNSLYCVKDYCMTICRQLLLTTFAKIDFPCFIVNI